MRNGFLYDVRTAARSLRRRPGTTLATTLTLALGIGATTALLGVVDQVLLRPLPYGQAEELHSVWGVTEAFDRIQPSYPDFQDWQAGASGSELAYAYGEIFGIRGDDGLEQVPGGAVSAGFFDVLATAPVLGRTFDRDEELAGAPVVVLSYGYWRGELGGRRDVLGRDLVLGGVPHTIVGVMPAGFAYPDWAELWVPFERVRATFPGAAQRDARVDARAVARVPGSVAREAAEAELRTIAGRLVAAHPETNEGLSLRLAPLGDEVVGEARGTLLLIALAAGLVLLLTCANVAAILLGRGLERARDLAVRRALGADRRRLIRQLVTENVILALAGGLLGSALAAVALRLMAGSAIAAGALAAVPLPRLGELSVDGRVLAVALGVTLIATLVFGVAPAVAASGGEPALRLREQGRGGSVGRRAIRLQTGLAVAQLAIAVALLAGAALLVRTLEELRRTDPGFAPESLVIMRVFPSDAYATGDARLALYDRMAERAAAVAGVTGAALINHMPYAGGRVPTSVRPIGESPADSAVGALFRTVSPGFFEVAGARIVRGRGFQPSEAAADVVVLSEGLARTLWPAGDVVGRHVALVNPTPPSPRRGETYTARVVGVVADIRAAPREDPLPTVYVPHRRDAWGNIFLIARASGEPASIVAPLRRALAEVDAALPVAELRPLSERIREATGRERVLSRLMLGFAALALVLSVVGTYGALSNLVLRRTREIGVRLALGAEPADVRRLILRRAAAVVLGGVALGSAGALGLARAMEGLLFGVAPGDPLSFAVAAALLALAAVVAAWIPALRAGRVDPVSLLGAE